MLRKHDISRCRAISVWSGNGLETMGLCICVVFPLSMMKWNMVIIDAYWNQVQLYVCHSWRTCWLWFDLFSNLAVLVSGVANPNKELGDLRQREIISYITIFLIRKIYFEYSKPYAFAIGDDIISPVKAKEQWGNTDHSSDQGCRDHVCANLLIFMTYSEHLHVTYMCI